MREDFHKPFGEFVTAAGGEVLSEGALRQADYLFRRFSVVCELKVLVDEALLKHLARVQEVTRRVMREHRIVAFGRPLLDLPRIAPKEHRELQNDLVTPIENIVRDANRQIRSTKETLGLPAAEGLLLIVNESNRLHTNPEVFLKLVAYVLAKRQNEERRFPEIRAVTYFSYQAIGQNSDGPFWVSGQMEPPKQAHMRDFQIRLGRAWFQYIGVPPIAKAASA